MADDCLKNDIHPGKVGESQIFKRRFVECRWCKWGFLQPRWADDSIFATNLLKGGLYEICTVNFVRFSNF